jgi:hypothetical protein
MKALLLLSAAILTGCVSGFASVADIEIVSKHKIPSYPGYVWAKYDVHCKDAHNTVYRVDFYGPDFQVTDALKQREHRLGCQDVADSDDWEDADEE